MRVSGKVPDLKTGRDIFYFLDRGIDKNMRGERTENWPCLTKWVGAGCGGPYLLTKGKNPA